MSEETENDKGDEIPEDDPWGAAMQEQEEVEAKEKSITESVIDQEQPTTAELESFAAETALQTNSDVNMDVILDVPLIISMEIGRTKITVRNLLQLNQGSVVELDRMAGEHLDVMVNGTLVAHGEVVLVNEKFGIRLTDVISPVDRIKNLRA